MKTFVRVLSIVLACCLLAAALLAGTSAFEGQWKGTVSSDKGASPLYLNIRVSQGEWSGTGGSSESAQMALANLSFADGALAFDLQDNGSSTIHFVLQAQADTLVGTGTAARRTAAVKLIREK